MFGDGLCLRVVEKAIGLQKLRNGDTVDDLESKPEGEQSETEKDGCDADAVEVFH